MIGQLQLRRALALPMTQEASGELRLFTIAPRLTPHVRHRNKYVDVPVSYQQAFLFASRCDRDALERFYEDGQSGRRSVRAVDHGVHQSQLGRAVGGNGRTCTP
jgi:hypothetical protein